jgi:ribosomal protein S18 acetylase RimI-like enzyme
MWCLDTIRNLYIRPLTIVDIDPIIKFTKRAFGSDAIAYDVHSMLNIYCQSSADRVPLEQQTSTLLQVSYYILVLNNHESERLIGITGLYRPIWAGEGVFWLGWFAIDPQYQGCGYGSRLLKASMELARAKGGRLLCVETSNNLNAALHLYEKMGFCPHGEVQDYWRQNDSLVILARDLHDIPIPRGLDTL